jgi:hypothetical protein
MARALLEPERMNVKVGLLTCSSILVLSIGVVTTAACGSDEHSAPANAFGGEAGAPTTGGNAGTSATAGEPTGGTTAGSDSGGAAASGGGDAGGATSIDFSQHRLYQHLDEKFQTYEECLEAQSPDFFINCYQTVDFCPDGSAVLILTDAEEPGSYVVNDDVIETSWPDALEAPESLRFDVVSPRHLVDETAQWDWLLANDQTVTYCRPTD